MPRKRKQAMTVSTVDLLKLIHQHIDKSALEQTAAESLMSLVALKLRDHEITIPLEIEHHYYLLKTY